MSDDASDIIERALERVQRAGAEASDALLLEGNCLETRVRGDEIDFVKQARERSLGIRALVRGTEGLSCAVTSTSDLSPEAVNRMAEETVELARATAPDPAAGLPEEPFETDPPDLKLLDAADLEVGIERRIGDARTAERAARDTDPRIDNSEGSQAETGFARIALGDSRGFRGAYESASHSLFSEPIARENGGMQRSFWMTSARALSALEAPDAVGRRAAARALQRLGARRVPTTQVPVIFDPVTAPSLLGHLVACVTGYAVYRRTSFLAERMGDLVASERVNVIDDGRLPKGLGSCPFDGEGQPTRRTEVVTGGRLSSWLLDSYSARKVGGQSTGNATRGPGSSPSAGPTNLWLEPGTGTLEDLVAETERGLLVTELIGHGFHPATGDYSRGAAGLWIENGEIAHPVEEITIAGNLGEMLLNVDRVADDLIWLGRVASPSVRVSRMTVAGE
ncbi:MAG: metallopeptidase TldD-related protein [Myxococcota bacterium]|nr:TldD/PmbA family protein [bacterium]MDP6074645.1 metallopeptidase TldD-related protein [Myxococcota bacterium]MDP6241969.1 metallopeptidase TldD-related protein [Myxococcota bacterium]MDP7072981.1 metallopeptidase TldD-related protein [Myxococcota bacterium]MDP7297775.1 metallopeptidase TldD-related protein [Myxococcota bacterium]